MLANQPSQLHSWELVRLNWNNKQRHREQQQGHHSTNERNAQDLEQNDKQSAKHSIHVQVFHNIQRPHFLQRNDSEKVTNSWISRGLDDSEWPPGVGNFSNIISMIMMMMMMMMMMMVQPYKSNSTRNFTRNPAKLRRNSHKRIAPTTTQVIMATPTTTTTITGERSRTRLVLTTNDTARIYPRIRSRLQMMAKFLLTFLVVAFTVTTFISRLGLAQAEYQHQQQEKDYQLQGLQLESAIHLNGDKMVEDFTQIEAKNFNYKNNNNNNNNNSYRMDENDSIDSLSTEKATIVVADTNRDISFNNNNLVVHHQYQNGENNDNNINNNDTFIGEDNTALMMISSSTTTTLTTSLASLSSASSSSSVIDDGIKLGNDVEADENADATEYIFDRTDVRIIFITLYTLVFCCCFFGNLLVILVVTLSRRLRSITNFFLANLALADFCVGLFCVMQNLSIYLIDSWVFGEFLCRMYQFVHSLSYTASIFILVVICMERYFAIVHPITCKQILTAARLRMVILTVWITSAVYSTPKFVFSKTIKNIHTEDGQEEEICVLDRKMFNSKLLDMINFVLLYVIPLLVMTVLYSKIAIALWRSSRGLTHHIQQQQQQQDNGLNMYTHQQQHPTHNHHYHHMQQHHHQQQQQQPPGTPISSSSSGGGGTGGILSRRQSSKYEKQRGVSITESQVSLDADRAIVSACRKTSFYHQHHHHPHHQHLHHLQQHSPIVIGNQQSAAQLTSSLAMTAPTQTQLLQQHQHQHQQSHQNQHQQQQQHAHLQRQSGPQRVTHNMSHSSSNVLRARRGVVRMLIIFVLTFALCNLPYHARKMWQYWSRSYRGDSNFNALLTPLTFLVTYFNSGINPLLYAFLSRNFRKGMKELLLCSWKKGKGKSSSNSSMHHKRTALQTHSLPTDTTHIGNEQL